MKKPVTEELDGIRDSFSGVVQLHLVSKLSRDKNDDDAFVRWIRKLEKHAELQKLTEQEKLVHFEQLLTELIHEILLNQVKNCYVIASEAPSTFKSNMTISAQRFLRKRVRESV